MTPFTYALRNLWRARQRSAIMIAAMAFAGFIMIFYASLLEGFIITSEQNAIGMETGQFQIHAKGYRDDPDIYKRIDLPEKIITELEKQGFQATSRLYAFALAASDSSSTGVLLRGIDPANEAQVTVIHNHLKIGSWVDIDDNQGVVIGHKLAKSLNIGLNDEIIVVGQAADGSMANEVYSIRGILKAAGESIDRAGFFMTQSAFRDLMTITEGCHEIAITENKKSKNHDIAQSTIRLAALFPKYEVKNWRQLHPVLARLLDMTNASLIFMLIITYAAVAMLTLNGMLMNVFERIREYGIVKALGMPPWKIFGVIVVEALIQVSLSSIFALTAAIPLCLYCEKHPLDLTSLAPDVATIAGIAFDPYWYCYLTINSVTLPIAFLFLFALLAIIYPAGKAAMLTPIEAIYHR